MPLSNPYQRYHQTAAQTADGSQLLVMSYEAILRWLTRAEAAIDEDRVEDAHNALISAQEIVRNLNWSLDHARGAEVAANLRRIYDFVLTELTWANVHKDKDRIASTRAMVMPLLDAWRVAVVKARRENRQATESAALGISQAG